MTSELGPVVFVDQYPDRCLERDLQLFVSRLLDQHAKAYLHDSTYSTRWGDRTAALDVWVLRADEREALPR